MRSVLAGLALGLFLAFVAGPVADSLGATRVDGPAPYQAWVDRSPMPTPGGSVAVVVGGDCGEVAAFGCTDGRTIWLARPWRRDRPTFFHELGHVFYDRTANQTRLRRRFERIVGAWDSERFAEHYALCSVAPRERWISPGVAYDARVCALLVRTGSGRGAL